MFQMKRIVALAGLIALLCSCQGAPLAAPTDTSPAVRPSSAPSAPGEIFGRPVSREEFDFAYKTTGIFSLNEAGSANEDARRNEAWKHLIFLREAQRRQVSVPRAELEAELKRLLTEKQVEYGSYRYHQWVQETFQEEPKVFEKRLEELMRVKKLLDGIMHPPDPVITDEQCRQKFLNQYNSMETEYVHFEKKEDAVAFHKRLTRKKWDAEKARNKDFSKPMSHMALEAIIDLWQVPTEDAYRIHAMQIGEIAAPAKMHKGWGIFRLKDKKTANLKEYTDQKKEEYRKVLTQVYYYNNSQKIIQDLFNEAALRDYERDKIIVIETSQGTFELQLWPKIAPKACENLIGLAEKGYYNGTVFHRVIKGFMIQGGDPTGTGRGGGSLWGEPFADEVGKDVQFESAWILAMANSGPNTNGSQFFITLAPTPHLNMKHTIFGKVSSGYETVQKIGQTPVDGEDRPKEEQKIVRMSLKKWPS